MDDTPVAGRRDGGLSTRKLDAHNLYDLSRGGFPKLTHYPKSAREITREMIAKAAAKNGGKLGSKGNVDPRRFRRL